MGEGPRGRGWHGRAARFFEQGDLKYVILRLLEEKPRHGYEIIKDLESRFGGSYAPSPGTVYPTLTMLEDLGYARVVPEEGGKKIYEITDEGRQHLAEHSTTVDDIFERISRFVSGFTDQPMTELNQAFQRLARVTYKTATAHIHDKELIEKIRDVVRRAVDEIDALSK
jgi:DNA-binding PadR family transcriptional regulator